MEIMNKRKDLKMNGFVGFKTIQELMGNNDCVPKEKGVYVIIREHNDYPTFLTQGTGGFF